MDINKAFDIIKTKLMVWLRELIRLLPNMVLAALVLILGFYIAKLARSFSKKLIGKLAHGSVITNLFSSFIYVLFISIAIFAALSILQLKDAVTSLLAGAGIVGLALAFAFQDIAANFMSGILIIVRHPLREGDIVKIKDYMGRVEAINLRDTVIRTFQGQMVIIPNKEVQQNPIENYTLLGKRRMDLTVGVSYGDDLEKVKQITLDAVNDIPGLATNEKPSLFYLEFGDSSINFTLRLWSSNPDQPNYLGIRDEAIIRIKKAYDANNITIPFPIRTLDFDIKGGAPLSQMPIQVKSNNTSNLY